MAVQLHRRDPFLVLGHEVDGLKPHRQGQLGGVEDGSCGDRGLAVAAIALLELAAVELTASVVATVRAQKPIGCNSDIDSSRGTVARKRHHVVGDHDHLTIGIGEQFPRLVEA